MHAESPPAAVACFRAVSVVEVTLAKLRLNLPIGMRPTSCNAYRFGMGPASAAFLGKAEGLVAAAALGEVAAAGQIG